jgi:flavin-dependent dehydrogenase
LVAEGRLGEEIFCHTGGAIPAGGMIKPYGRLGKTWCLLAGDAAGLTNPITGAGINSAVISGKLAGETADALLSGQQQAASDYEEDLDDLFGASLARALTHKHRLAQLTQSQDKLEPDQLRSGWIAYSAYWSPQNPAQTEKNLCPA